MSGLFKGASVERLVERRAEVDREIASLTAFQSKIDRRIAYLKRRQIFDGNPGGESNG